MRVLFTTTNWRGLYSCMLPLGWALQAAGHEVRFACAPPQTTTISHAGLTPVPVLEPLGVVELERLARYAAAVRQPDQFTDDVPLLHPITGEPVTDVADYDVATNEPVFRRESQEILDRNFDAAVRLARAWRPSLVIHDLMSPEGVLAAQVTGVPSAYHSLGMFGAAEASLYDPTSAAARYGVTLERSLIGYVIDPTPSMIMPAHGEALRLPIRYLTYDGPGEMPLWVLEQPSRPRVTLLWSRGTANIFGTEVPTLRHAIDAAVALGAEVVVTAPPAQADALGAMPEHVRVLREFPLHMLLPTSDAIIHQGSGNPMMSGAAAGLPQLMLAMTDDGVEMGRRFAHAGSALVLSGLNATADEVRAGTAELLGSPRLREAAKKIQADMAANPTAADLVAPLERLAGTGRLTAADLAAALAVRSA
ncbi:nucleotide disphospho-sugar-binding domain-containing protein [Micromonospora sp. NPDC047548]|uniref:nucleotide disphospho-sugar-binding domain-containing protein n=1 Tax=Micromonospora sp. NPDC047548 TaxID=3155624 RepID=UPI0033C5D4F3